MSFSKTEKSLKPKHKFCEGFIKEMKFNYGAYLLVLPVVVYFIVFAYKPMYGLIIAFKDFSPGAGIIDSPWTTSFGFQHFIDFFSSVYFGRIVINTLIISLTALIIGFPAPIIFALLLNEVQNTKYKRIIQTITYTPHFISLVVICSLIRLFTADTGIIVQFMSLFGFEPVNLLSQSQYFVPTYVLSGIWQGMGWSSIIYIAALTGIDQQLYEAARIDGATRLQQAWHITLPGISSTIIILFILNLGGMMNVGFEKIILLYNPAIYETADVISSYVYRKGLLEFNYSYSAAVGLFNSIINFILVITFNKISRKVSDVSLW